MGGRKERRIVTSMEEKEKNTMIQTKERQKKIYKNKRMKISRKKTICYGGKKTVKKTDQKDETTTSFFVEH